MRCEDDTYDHGSIEVETLICETETDCIVGPDDRVAHDVVVWNYKRNKAYVDIEVQSAERRVTYENGEGAGAEQRNLVVRPGTRAGPERREERFWVQRDPDATAGSDILEVEVRYAMLPDTENKNTSVPETLPEVEIR